MIYDQHRKLLMMQRVYKGKTGGGDTTEMRRKQVRTGCRDGHTWIGSSILWAKDEGGREAVVGM